MRCLVDFTIDSDLCLHKGVPPVTFRAPDGTYTIEISNVASEFALPQEVLSAQMIFEVDELDATTRDTARGMIADALSLLAFTTSRKFSLQRLIRLIDWTPGVIERKVIVCTEVPEWDLAEPLLDQSFLETAHRLMAMRAGDAQRAALRWFRLGIQANSLEDQFSYFWFALEIVAEALKGTEKVPSTCPTCSQPLYCEKCKEHPTHRRFRGQAIDQIIERIHPKDWKGISETLQLIRHTLMHGRRIESIADKLPCTGEQALTKLAGITWNAIGLMFDPAADPRPEERLHYGYVDNFARRTLVAMATVVTTLKPEGDPANPRLSDFPWIDLEQVETDQVSEAAPRGPGVGST